MNRLEHPAGHVLQAYHDGELDTALRAEITAHCRDCDACRAELDALEQTTRLLADARMPGLKRSVWPRVRPDREPASGLRPIFAYTAVAAGIALGVLLGPIPFTTEEIGSDTAWSESLTVWNGEASSSLLTVYQFSQE